VHHGEGFYGDVFGLTVAEDAVGVFAAIPLEIPDALAIDVAKAFDRPNVLEVADAVGLLHEESKIEHAAFRNAEFFGIIAHEDEDVARVFGLLKIEGAFWARARRGSGFPAPKGCAANQGGRRVGRRVWRRFR